MIEGTGLSETILAKFAGVSHSIGNTMSYHVLKDTGRVITRSTVQPVTKVEQNTEPFAEKSLQFPSTIKSILFSDKHIISNKNPNSSLVLIEQYQDYILEYQNQVLNNSISPIEFQKRKHIPDTAGYPYLESELAIPIIDFDSPQLARVTKRLKSDNGDPVGVAHDNPLIGSRSYIV